MKKKAKGIVGLCLVAALAVGGVGTYAYAVDLDVFGHDGKVYFAEGGCSVWETGGSAYTTEIGSAMCHCTVSATYWWYDDNNNVIYSNGNGSGGERSASVTMTNRSNGAVAASVAADHTANARVGGYASGQSANSWSN